MAIGFWEERLLQFQAWTLKSKTHKSKDSGSSAKKPRAKHLVVGERGEQLAYFFLRRNGFQIVARRWRSHSAPGDLDLVAWEGETLAILEVKTRTSHAVATAEASVDHNKQRVLRRLARAYLREAKVEAEALRFDVLSLYLLPGQPPEISLIRNAFGWHKRDPRYT